MQGQAVLDLLGVDVHAAGDDREGPAVGEEEVAVLVDMADVPGGRPVGVLGVLRLTGARVVVVVAEREFLALEVHGSRLPDGQHLAVLTADPQLAEEAAAAHGARLAQPLVGADEGDPVGLRRRVVLVQDGTPPGHHPPFDLDGAGRCGVDGDLQRRHVVRVPHLARQLQHPYEHGGHPLAVRHPVPFDRFQRPLRIEGVHEDDRAAGRRDDVAEAEGRCVVERGRAEVDGVLAEAVHGLEEQLVRAHHLADVTLGERRCDALGAAGGAGGVEHVGAAGLVGRGFG